MSKILVSIIEDEIVNASSVMHESSAQDLIKYNNSDFEIKGVYDSVQSFLKDRENVCFEGQHVLLYDIGLHGIAGIQRIARIFDKFSAIKIIVLSLIAEQELVFRALGAGIFSYVLQCDGVEELMTSIKVVANGSFYMTPTITQVIIGYLRGNEEHQIRVLSYRQRQILGKLAEGKSYRVIADELYLSVETVRSHIKKMYRIMMVNNKIDAVRQFLNGSVG